MCEAPVYYHYPEKSCHAVENDLTNILYLILFLQFIQPAGSPATEVMMFSLPHHCFPCLPAVSHYLRQNLLIFLHVPKYTDSNTAHHFKVTPP